MLANQPARVVTAPTKKYLVVQPSRVNKGRALTHVLAGRTTPWREGAELVRTGRRYTPPFSFITRVAPRYTPPAHGSCPLSLRDLL